jgi:hypothetical protein
VLLHDAPEVIHFDHAPLEVLMPLVDGRLPVAPARGDFHVEVRPDPAAAAAAIGHVLTTT